MKGYIKGLVTGLLIGAAVTAIPVVAENIDALFNEVRININGIDRVQWGESIKLDDGTQTPYSILYNGTTYLPLRKTAELLGKDVYWNGDSKTVSVVDSGDKTTVAKKPDKNGNMWRYATFTTPDGDYYLFVEDENRGFSRVYCTMGRASLRVTEDSIYFVRKAPIPESANYYPYSEADLIRLDFANDENTQDGEIISDLPSLTKGDVVMDGNYIFYIAPRGRTEVIVACNYITGEQIEKQLEDSPYATASELKLKSRDENSITFGFSMRAYDYEKTFDKNTKEFGETKMVNLEDVSIR